MYRSGGDKTCGVSAMRLRFKLQPFLSKNFKQHFMIYSSGVKHVRQLKAVISNI